MHLLEQARIQRPVDLPLIFSNGFDAKRTFVIAVSRQFQFDRLGGRQNATSIFLRDMGDRVNTISYQMAPFCQN